MITTLIFIFIWTSGTYGYYALLVSVPNLSINTFVNTALAASSEGPPSLIFMAVATLLGSRKSGMIVLQVLAGLCCLVIGFLPKAHFTELVTASYMVGIFAFNAIGLQLWLVTAEVYPTNLRSQAVSICSGVARVITLSSAFIAELSTIWRPLPMLLIGTSSLISSILTYFLPESQDIELPHTFNQAFQNE